MITFRPSSLLILGTLCLTLTAPSAFAQKDKLVPKVPKVPTAEPAPADKKPADPALAKINKKLTTITFPKVEFKEATVREAFEYLTLRSKALDPDKEGVNIVLKLPPPAVTPFPPKPPIPGLDPEPADPTRISGGGDTRITLTLQNVPMIEVIKYITALSNLEYQVDAKAVTITPLKLELKPEPPAKKR